MICQWCKKNEAVGTGAICDECLKVGGTTVACTDDPPIDTSTRQAECLMACEGFNPGVLRELAEHCLKGHICYDAWEDELDVIVERLRT